MRKLFWIGMTALTFILIVLWQLNWGFSWFNSSSHTIIHEESITTSDGSGNSRTTSETTIDSDESGIGINVGKGFEDEVESEIEKQLNGEVIWKGAMQCESPTTEVEFQVFPLLIEAESKDEDKLLLAKVIVQTWCLSSPQARELGQLIQNEPERIKFLKFAYGFVSNPEFMKHAVYDLKNQSYQQEFREFSKSLGY